MLKQAVSIPSRKATSPSNQTVERVQPYPLTDEAVPSPDMAMSNLFAGLAPDILAEIDRLNAEVPA